MPVLPISRPRNMTVPVNPGVMKKWFQGLGTFYEKYLIKLRLELIIVPTENLLMCTVVNNKLIII